MMISEAKIKKITRRVFGSEHASPCADPSTRSCRRFACQSLGHCAKKHDLGYQLQAGKLKAQKRLAAIEEKKASRVLRSGKALRLVLAAKNARSVL